MNWKNTMIKYVRLRFFVSMSQIDSAKIEKTVNLFIDCFFKYCRWFCHWSLLFIIIFNHLHFFFELTTWFQSLRKSSRSMEMFFLKWVNWYFVETNIDSCVFVYLITFSCEFFNAFKVSTSIFFIVMIVISFTKFHVVVFKFSLMHASNRSTL